MRNFNGKWYHALVWRGWHYVFVDGALSREEAIAKALKERPHYIPEFTELHYGSVGPSGSAVHNAR